MFADVATGAEGGRSESHAPPTLSFLRPLPKVRSCGGG